MSLRKVPFAVSGLDIVEKLLSLVELIFFDKSFDSLKERAVSDYLTLFDIFYTIIVSYLDFREHLCGTASCLALFKTELLIFFFESAVRVFNFLQSRVVLKSQNQIRTFLHFSVLLNSSFVLFNIPYQSMFVNIPSYFFTSILSKSLQIVL